MSIHTYTITAVFHMPFEFDSELSHEENYESMLSFFESAVDGHGAYFIKITEIEED